MNRCDYCSRESRDARSETCNGCGAPLSSQPAGDSQRLFNTADSASLAYLSSVSTPAFMYDHNILDGDISLYVGSPGRNIPVNTKHLSQQSKLSNFLMAAASVGASILPRR